jgi:hypothetical protein
LIFFSTQGPKSYNYRERGAQHHSVFWLGSTRPSNVELWWDTRGRSLKLNLRRMGTRKKGGDCI